MKLLKASGIIISLLLMVWQADIRRTPNRAPDYDTVEGLFNPIEPQWSLVLRLLGLLECPADSFRLGEAPVM